MTQYAITTVPTRAFADQKPGTSGLRKKTRVFLQEHYTENFVQAVLDAMPGGASGATLVVGGDGRYFLPEAIQLIIRISCANKVRKLVIGQNGILSTPAASHLIRTLRASGGILCTASHNPGGLENDFGIKYNVSNGGPAPQAVTDAIFEKSRTLTQYAIAALPAVDLSQIGEHQLDGLTVEIVDSVDAYVTLMKEQFDFVALRAFLQAHPDFKILFDSMHGVTGPYVQRIYVQELGLASNSVMNCEPKPDFGGGHPDPNLTYAHALVERVNAEKISLAFASDGDGDRNMVLAHDWFVTPSDSVAVIAAHAAAIPYLRSGLRGVARSMPTSRALDRVAAKLGVECYETPTGWKFFGSLMDAGRLSLCGEESFGTGADHIREKDGVWATLAWLSIVAAVEPHSVRGIMQRHFAEYGRNYFQRYDYEDVAADAGAAVMRQFQSLLPGAAAGPGALVPGAKLEAPSAGETYTVRDFCDFCYTDPADGSVSPNQGLCLTLEPEARVIVRLSGTGSSGATIRIYLEKYVASVSGVDQMKSASAVLAGVSEIALKLTRLAELTGRREPTVVT